MGPCGCNHSKICDWCVGWSTVTETNLGAQASSNEHQREDKQGPSIYLLGSCHSNNVGFMARSTFAALHHASLTLLVANFLCILVILLISWLSESMVPNNSLDAFGVQDLTLCSKRLQVVRTSSNQRLTSPVFLNDELFQRSIRLLRVFVVGDGLVVFFCLGRQHLLKGSITTSDGTMALKGPMSICTSADLHPHSHSLLS